MKFRYSLTITACAFAAHALLIPSCVQWHIGEAIRESAETRVGVLPAEACYVGEKKPMRLPDAELPVGALWDGRTEIAREARYEADTPLVTVDGLAGTTPARAQNIELTEHYRRVNFSYGKFSGLTTTAGERFDPAGQKMEPVTSMEDWRWQFNAKTMGCAEVEHAWWYPAAWVLAAPFDYVIDPVLTVASAPAATLVTGVMLCYWKIIMSSTPKPQPADADRQELTPGGSDAASQSDTALTPS